MAELSDHIGNLGGEKIVITQERIDAVNAKIAEVNAHFAAEHNHTPPAE